MIPEMGPETHTGHLHDVNGRPVSTCIQSVTCCKMIHASFSFTQHSFKTSQNCQRECDNWEQSFSAALSTYVSVDTEEDMQRAMLPFLRLSRTWEKIFGPWH